MNVSLPRMLRVPSGPIVAYVWEPPATPAIGAWCARNSLGHVESQKLSARKDFPTRRMTIAESSAKVFHCHWVLVVTVVWATSFMISPDVTLRSWTCPSFRRGHYKIHSNKSHYNMAKDVLGVVFFKMYISPRTKKGTLVPVHFSFSSNLNGNVQPCEKGWTELLWADDHHAQYQRQTWPHSIWQPPFKHNYCDWCGRLSNPTPQKQLLLPPNCSPRLSWPPEHRYRSLTSQACAALNCIHYWLDSIPCPSHEVKVQSLPLCSTNNKNHNTKLFRGFLRPFWWLRAPFAVPSFCTLQPTVVSNRLTAGFLTLRPRTPNLR